MGIYRVIEFMDDKGYPTSLEYAQGKIVTIHVSEPGLEWTATLKPEDWTETRTNCFCCSCGEREGADVYCRNHGFAGTRPCELHNMPGQTDDNGLMPESVQTIRARRVRRGAEN